MLLDVDDTILMGCLEYFSFTQKSKETDNLIIKLEIEYNIFECAKILIDSVFQ